MTPDTPRRRALFGLLVVACVLGVFSPVLWHDFLLWDDKTALLDNPYLHPPSRENLLAIWSGPIDRLYVPVTYTLFSLEAWVSRFVGGPKTTDLSPFVFHLGGLLLHAANGLATFSLLRRIAGSTRAAAIGALVFCLHPLQVEAVSWATETRGLLSSFFALLAIGQYLRFAASGGSDGEARETHYGLGFLFLALALLAKPLGVVTPALAWVFDVAFLRRGLRKPTIALAPWFAMSAAMALFTKYLQPDASIPDVPAIWARIPIAGDALGFYLRGLVWPFGVIPDYGRTPAAVMQSAWFFVGWSIPASVLAISVRLRSRVGVAALVLSAAALLPVLGLVPFRYQVFSTVADRYAYLAMLGPAVFAAHLTGARAGRGILAFSAVVLTIWAAASVVQTLRWRNTNTLFEHTLRHNPASHAAHNNLGVSAYLRRDDRVAERHFLSALELTPDDPKVHNNLGLVYGRTNRPTEAVTHFARALQLFSDYPEAYDNFSNLLAVLPDQGRAIAELRRRAAETESFATVWQNLAVLLARLSRFDASIAHFQALIEDRPEWAEARKSFAFVLLDAGRRGEALVQMEEALRIDPADADLRSALALVRQDL